VSVTIAKKAAKAAQAAATAKAVQKGKKGFQKGKSGNPKGRPKGSRNKASLLVEQIVDDEAGAIARKLIDQAKEGEPYALKLVIDRVLPRLRSRPITFPLPQINGPGDILKAHKVVLAAVGAGEITPDEAATVTGLLEATQKAIETTEMAADIERIMLHLELGR
jgi:Family of unknown function (DUF5681)